MNVLVILKRGKESKMSMPGNFPIFAVEFFALRLRKTLSYRDFFVKENIYSSI